LGCANNILLVAKKELAEYQDPVMAVDTLCEVWDQMQGVVIRYFSHKDGNDYYFFQQGATSKSRGKGCAISFDNHKIIEEPSLPWKDIDDNVPEAEKYERNM